MDISKLQNKRQLNVQEQNAVLKNSILCEAYYWRKNEIPEGLCKSMAERGIDSKKCLLLDYEQDYPGCSTDFGKVVAEDGRFYEFDIDMSTDRKKVIELYEWKEITNSIEINAHKPGTGATWGYLALEVLSELNKK